MGCMKSSRCVKATLAFPIISSLPLGPVWIVVRRSLISLGNIAADFRSEATYSASRIWSRMPLHKLVRQAQHHSGNAAVVDGGLICREQEFLGVSAKVISDPEQLRVSDDFRSRHSREVLFIGVVLTELSFLHFHFPSPDCERARLQCQIARRKPGIA